MAKVYYKRVKAGLLDIESVPKKWRDEVQAMLDADN